MKKLLLLGVLGSVYGCDKPCLSNCYGGAEESAHCLQLCECEYPYSIARFGGRVVTEDGREFVITDIPSSESYYVSEVYDCKLRCGQLCFRFAQGWNLLKCVDFCGCGMFVTETTARSQHPSVLLQIESQQVQGDDPCRQQCRALCHDDICMTVCEADLCARPMDSWSVLAIFLAVFAGILIMAVYLARRK